MDILAIVGVIHDSHLDWNTLLLGLQIDDIIEEVGAMAVDVAHELLQSLLGMEHLLTGLSLLVGTHIGKRYGDAGIQICQLSHSLGYDVVLIRGGGKYGWVRPELLACSLLVGLSHYLHGIERLSLFVFLLIDLAVAEHLREHLCGERVHTTHTHSVESSADFV